MIYNNNLKRLTEFEIVKDFMNRHKFQVAPCDEDSGLILFRLPYVLEFKDALIENYLEIYFSDLDSGIYIIGNCAFGCSLELGNQDLATTNPVS